MRWITSAASRSLLLGVVGIVGCSAAWMPSSTVTGRAAYSGPLAQGNQRVTAELTGFRAGLTASYGARLALYGEYLEVGGWSVDGAEARGADLTLFGAELGIPLLFPLAIAMGFTEQGLFLAHLAELDLGLTTSRSTSGRHIGLGLSLDSGFLEFNARAQYRWLDQVPFTSERFDGQAELQGWTLHLGFSVPGDLLLVEIDEIELPFL